MDFEILKELVQTVTRNKVKQIEVLGNPGNEESRSEQLYDAIAKGKVDSDDAAAKLFFNVNSGKDPNYRKLKNRLVRQLINTSLFIDVQQPMFNERITAFYNCYRDFAAAYILLSKGAKKSGTYLLQQVLEQTVKYEFIELTAEIARLLRQESARQIADRQSHETFSELHREYEKKRTFEMTALNYFEDLTKYYILKRSPNDDVHRLAAKYFEELYPEITNVNTSEFIYLTYHIGIISNIAAQNDQMALELCRQALSILQERKNTGRGMLHSLALQKLSCLTQLRLFELHERDDTIAFCFQQTQEGGLNWFRTLEVMFYNYIYTKDYEKALDTYIKAFNHPNFPALNGNARDKWKLFGGYLHLLASFSRLNVASVEKIAGAFRYNKFINDFDIFDKDKDGMNIPLVLLPVLFNLATDNFEDLGKSEEALDKYRKRYLENDINRRSAIFVKILLAISKLPFEPESAKRKIAKETERLRATKAELAGQSYEVEIIPYEDLIELLSQ